MRREPLHELMKIHTRLCEELGIKRDAATAVLRQMYGKLLSNEELEAYRQAIVAVDDVKKRLSAVSLKMAAHQKNRHA